MTDLSALAEKDATIAALRKRVEELEVALEPFSDVTTEGVEDYPDDHKCTVHAGRVIHYALTIGDFRRAAAVFNWGMPDAALRAKGASNG